ncbi:MAG: hypothetical protein IPK10_08070 [Bacteroidetes bacterium]|nr:hypothetical protein [Bacteroidota bacterium]
MVRMCLSHFLCLISWSPIAGLNNSFIYNPIANNVTSTTVFRDTITTPFGCKTIIPITVSSGLPITCSPLVVSYPRCANENFTVKATYTGGGYPNHYTWTRDNVGGLYPDTSTITANLPPGTYNFKVFIDDTCGGLCSQNINVVVNPIPVTTATGPSTGLTYTDLTYQVSGFLPGSTFQWQQQNVTLSNVPGGGAISIVDNAISSPYPSTISVSGKSSTAKLAAVRINGLSHAYSADIAIVLVSPTGQALELMTDAGGAFGFGISNVNLIFSDTASSFLSNTQIVSGSFKPTTGGIAKTWPAPGPGTLNQVNPLFNSLFGNVNGSWNLFILDDASQDVGSLTSWSLDFMDSPAPSNIVSANDSILVVQANAAGTINYSCVCTAPSGCSSVSSAATTVVTVINDNVCNAMPLSVGLNGPFTNQGATIQTGEVIPTGGSC